VKWITESYGSQEDRQTADIINEFNSRNTKMKKINKLFKIILVLFISIDISLAATCNTSTLKRVDFAQMDGIKAIPGSSVISSIGEVDVKLSADVGYVQAMATEGAFSSRTDDGDPSLIMMNLSGANVTTQHNKITITFPKAVNNVSFAYTAIDLGNGKSHEQATFHC